MADQMPPADLFLKTYQFTKTLYRDVYPSIDPTSPKLSQDGKVVMVTGASQGIGQAIAIGFAKANAAGIVLIARNTAKLKETKAAIAKVNTNTKVLIVPTDLVSQPDCESLEATVKREFGKADVLVNAHGLWGGGGLVGAAPAEKWWRDFEVNIKGTYLITSAFLHLLGTENKGRIVNVSSFGAQMVAPGGSSYGVTKFALNRLTEFIALEYPNVITMAIHPGTCATSILKDHPEFTPFAVDTVELAAGVAVYLTTPQADFLNGRFMHANWSVDDLEEKKEEIVSQDLLKFNMKAEFGPQEVSA